MSYLEDIYMKRINRFGNNYQDRMQGKREQNFEMKMQRSVYLVAFNYGDEVHPGTFEKYKQDDTKTLHYLLTRTSLIMPAGTILWLPKSNKERDILEPWMIYWLEQIEASGYNRYIMLRMSHEIKWRDRDGVARSAWAYFYGQEDNMLKDELKSRSRAATLYTENLKMSFFITPTNPYIKKDDYFELADESGREAYRVTGMDTKSTKGVEYVTVDPIYEYDREAVDNGYIKTPENTGLAWLKKDGE